MDGLGQAITASLIMLFALGLLVGGSCVGVTSCIAHKYEFHVSVDRESP